MPVVTGHALQYEKYVRPEELSGVRTGTYPRLGAQTHKHTHTSRMCMHAIHTHRHYFKANSSETREDRPPCVQVTEWITCRAKMLASCLSEQHWMAFRWILQSLVQTLSQYWGNGQSWRMNNSEVILGGNVCLGHFTLQSCQSVVRSLAHSQHRLHLQHLTAQLHNYS